MGTHDPHSPDYRPPGYSPAAPHRGHGHGATFGADLFDLYLAGRVYFPETAQTYSQVGFALADCASTLENQAGQLGNPAATLGLEALQDELQTATRSMASLLERLGETFVTMATDFERTDEAAAHHFGVLYGQAQAAGELSTATPSVRVPPAPDGLHPPAPPVKAA